MEKAIVLSVMSAVFVFIAVLDTVNKIREKNNSGDNQHARPDIVRPRVFMYKITNYTLISHKNL